MGRRVQNRGKKKFVFDFFKSDIQIAKKPLPPLPSPLGLDILCEWPLRNIIDIVIYRYSVHKLSFKILCLGIFYIIIIVLV
jgi:hypothetical protein